VLHITPSERSALQSLATGQSASEMSGRLGLTEDEMDELLNALFDRMGVETEREAVAAAFKRGLVDADRRSGRRFTRLTQWTDQDFDLLRPVGATSPPTCCRRDKTFPPGRPAG